MVNLASVAVEIIALEAKASVIGLIQQILIHLKSKLKIAILNNFVAFLFHIELFTIEVLDNVYKAKE